METDKYFSGNIDDLYLRAILNKKEYNYTQSTNASDHFKIYNRQHEFKIDRNKFIPRGYQLFAVNYINLRTRVKRLLISYHTGIGKTATSLSIAKEYIDYFKRVSLLNNNYNENSVIIVGFSRQVFINELLKYPEFGYVTIDDINKLKQLKSVYEDNLTDKTYTNYIEFKTSLRRRITDRKNIGYFKFFGYKELVNDILGDIDLSKIINIRQYIWENKDKLFSLDRDIIKIFLNSVTICDEIHNVYNSVETNIWGFVLEMITRVIGTRMCLLLLSATPMSHSATEIISLMNILNSDSNKMYNKNDYFDIELDQDENNTSKMKTLSITDSNIERIGKEFAGKYLYFEDKDPKYYPSSSFIGSKISEIDYLSFIRSPMTELQFNSYKEALNDSTLAMGHDSTYLSDIVLPDPNNPNLGIFKSKDLNNYMLLSNSEKFYTKMQVKTVRTKMGNNIISGNCLNIDSSLNTISPKYYKMVSDIIGLIKANNFESCGKIFIYHKYVNNSGVLFLREIFVQNGFIDQYNEPSDSTLDIITGLTLREHNKKYNGMKTFVPARIITIHSELDDREKEAAIEAFNSLNNVEGHRILLLIGSDTIKESFEIKCTRHLMIAYRPDNISTLIQIFGRVKRNGSHIDLEPSKRNVTYRIYTIMNPDSTMSYEEASYMKSINDYKLIQQVERAMHKYAVDSIINYEYLKNNVVSNSLGALPYELPYDLKKITKQIDLKSFNAHYFEQELNIVLMIIKRLFIEFSNVFTIDDIIKYVKEPPFSIQIKGPMISNDIIIVALDMLSIHESDLYKNVLVLSNHYDNQNSNKIIIINGFKWIITKKDKYYILVQYDKFVVNEPEVIYRATNLKQLKRLSIIKYIQHMESATDLTDSYKTFIAKWVSIDNLNDYINIICKYTLEFQAYIVERFMDLLFLALTDPDRHKKKYLEIPEYQLAINVLTLYNVFNIIKTYDSVLTPVKQIDEFVSVEKDNKKCSDCEYIKHLLAIHDIERFSEWFPDEHKQAYIDFRYHIYNELVKPGTGKASKRVLPVMHFIGLIPRLYIPGKGFIDNPNYGFDSFQESRVENDIIIGYNIRKPNTVKINFKIRVPIHKQDSSGDNRKLFKGTYCETKLKVELMEYLEKLENPANYVNSSIIKKYSKIKNDNLSQGSGKQKEPLKTVSSLCVELKSKLIYLEMKERLKPNVEDRIRFFYFIWENKFINFNN
jgi:hypothetical protein